MTATLPENKTTMVQPPVRIAEPRRRLEKTKLFVEICAFLAAGGFFVYHFLSGWFEPSTSTRIETSRVHDPLHEGQDLLAITARIKNGTGLIRLGDAIAYIRFDDTALTNRFEGIRRFDFPNGQITPGKIHPKTPSTGLGPEEEIMLSTLVSVPQHATCMIDTAILIRRPRNSSFHQARSAAISLPLSDASKNEATPIPPQVK